MLKISKLADYATQIMHILMQQGMSMSTAVIAKKTAISEPTVAKVLKKLTEVKLLQSTQGIKGGYQLALSPEKISLAAIIAAIDGKPAITECSKQTYDCAQEHKCVLRGNWRYINHIIFNLLDNISLQDMSNVIPNQPAQFLQLMPKRLIKKGMNA